MVEYYNARVWIWVFSNLWFRCSKVLRLKTAAFGSQLQWEVLEIKILCWISSVESLKWDGTPEEKAESVRIMGPALDWAGQDPAYKIATWDHIRRVRTSFYHTCFEDHSEDKEDSFKIPCTCVVPFCGLSETFRVCSSSRSLHVHQGKGAGDLVTDWEKRQPLGWRMLLC